MSNPRKHHYLPQFYLNRWTNADGQVCVYRRPREAIEIKWLHPGGVGFQKDLYSISSRRNPAARQELETKFMTPIDTQAAKALAHIETHGSRPEDSKLRAGWTRFILSMLYRNPRQIALIRRKVRQQDQATLVELEQTYASVREPDGPATLQEYRANTATPIYEETEAQLIRTVIESDWISDHLSNMHWTFLTLERPVDGFLTGDDPVMTSNGVGHRDGFVVVPIGPSSVFLAVNDLAVRDAFADQPDKLERAFNDAIATQAEVLVIGSNDHHRQLVDDRLGRASKSRDHGWNEESERHSWASPVIFLNEPRRRSWRPPYS